MTTTTIEALRALKETIPAGAAAPHREWNDIFRDGQRSGIDLAIKTLEASSAAAPINPQRLIAAARAVLDHRYQMGAPTLQVHTELEMAIWELTKAGKSCAPAAPATQRDCTSCPMQAVMEGCCSAAGIAAAPAPKAGCNEGPAR